MSVEWNTVINEESERRDTSRSEEEKGEAERNFTALSEPLSNIKPQLKGQGLWKATGG